MHVPLKRSALAAALTLALAACGGDGGGGGSEGANNSGNNGASPAQGVTDDEVLFGMAAPVTGPVAYGGIGGMAAMEAYFDYINEQGGVHGRQLKMVLEDTEYDPGKTLAAVRKLWTSDKVFAIPAVFGSAPYLAAQSYITQQNIPSFGWGPSSDVYCQTGPSSFGIGTRYEIQSGIAIDYIAKELGAKQNDGKISVVIPDDAYGDSVLRGAEAAAEANGMELASVDRVARTATEFGAVINNLKQVGADYVVIVPTRSAAAGIMKAAEAQGLDVIFMSPSDATTEAAVLDLAGPHYADRYYGVMGYSSWDDTDDELIQLMREQLEAAGETAVIEEKNLFALFGMAHAVVVVKALEEAGENPTQESFIEALNNFEDVDLGGLTDTITYEGDFKLPGTTAQVYKAEQEGDGYALKAVTDFQGLDYEVPFPDDCPNAPE